MSQLSERFKITSHGIDVITDCFCGGAEPSRKAEIRVASIRGQLRWWLRTLGGFTEWNNVGRSVREQENYLFGTAAGNQGRAGNLLMTCSLTGKSVRKAGADLGADNINSSKGYLLFPLRSQQAAPVYRGMLEGGSTSFTLTTRWRDPREDPAYPSRDECAQRLISVFAHLGSLGFRGRRGFGALAPSTSGSLPDLENALAGFNTNERIVVRRLKVTFPSASAAINELGTWLKGWRSHGSSTRGLNSTGSGFHHARRDHNEGLAANGNPVALPDNHKPAGNDSETFRPALGLPIIQHFSNPRRPEVQWHKEYDRAAARKNRGYRGEGRFASPVLLRPHRKAPDEFHGLVVFLDVHRWQPGESVFLNGEQRQVSLDLYNLMRNDPNLDSVWPVQKVKAPGLPTNRKT